MIKINNLHLANDKNVLNSGLNMHFKSGEFWAIIGKNGVGKTTLLNTLCGFNPYKKGSILINQIELNTMSILNRAQNIAYLSQLTEPGLNCTVEQSVSYGRYPWHQKPNTKLDDVSAIERSIEQMELSQLRNNNIQQLSGGEMRKVEIATILAQNSDIMLLDEPLNHLDIAFRYKLMQLLKKQSTNKLIIMVTHDIQYVSAYCSHVLILMDNNQTMSGQCKEMINQNNLNHALGIKLPENIL